MAFKTVGELKDSVAGILSGINLDNIAALEPGLERAARTLIQFANVPEASGFQAITLYGSVYDYAAPSTIFGGALVDLRPAGVSRSPIDYVYKKPIELFDRTKCFIPNGYSVTFEHKKGTGIMRVATPRPIAAVVLDPMTSTTGWTNGGTAGTISLDQTVFYQSPASLRTTLTGAGTGYVEKSITSTSLTAYQGVGVVFLAVYLPSVTNLTSLSLRLGSDSANYYEVASVTAPFIGSFVSGDFMLVPFDLSTASTVGAPVITTIHYARVSVASAGTLTNVRFGDLFIALPSAHEVLFESAAIFMDTSGNLSNLIQSESDQIILNDAAYTLYEYQAAFDVALMAGGTLASGITATLNQRLFGIRSPRTGAIVQLGLYDRYNADNPSNEIREVGSYY